MNNISIKPHKLNNLFYYGRGMTMHLRKFVPKPGANRRRMKIERKTFPAPSGLDIHFNRVGKIFMHQIQHGGNSKRFGEEEVVVL